MPVYIWNDKVLMDNLAVAVDINCCCDAGPPAVTCCDGGTEPLAALVTVTGLFVPYPPNTCCPSLNGTYSLELYYDDPDDDNPACCYYRYALPDSQACKDEIGLGPEFKIFMRMCRLTPTTASVYLEITGSTLAPENQAAAWSDPNIQGLVPGECNWSVSLPPDDRFVCNNFDPATVTF